MKTRCVKLPEYLDEWLEEIVKDIGRSPDDFITEILYRYYDIWMIGRESVRRRSDKISDKIINETRKQKKKNSEKDS